MGIEKICRQSKDDPLTVKLRICAATGPVTTKIDVDDDGLVLEVRVDVAARVGEVSQGPAPGAGVRTLVRDVSRNAVPLELPDADARRPPLHGRDAAPEGVVVLAKGGRVSLDATSRLVVGRPVAVLLEGRAGLLALVVHLATGLGVQGRLVAVGPVIDGLHDIDLAVCRPVVRIREPQGGPGATAVWCVDDVEYEEPLVVLILARHTDTVSTCRGGPTLFARTALATLTALAALVSLGAVRTAGAAGAAGAARAA